MKILGAFILLVILVVIGFNSCTVRVDETQTGVLLEFGKIKSVLDQPGLYLKKPFVQNTTYLDKRLLNTNIKPAPVITVDKQRLTVDSYTLWRIKDARRFMETMRGLRPNAEQRLDDIVYSLLRDVLGQKSFADVLKREFLAEVRTRANKQVEDFGMEIVDVRIKQADLPATNEKAVYQRMMSEREQIAQKYRSEGEQEASKLRAETDREVQIIVAEAKKTAEQAKGEGDARALEIYATAFNRDPQFYLLWRTLESYRITLTSDTSLVLSTDSDYLKLLQGVTKPSAATAPGPRAPTRPVPPPPPPPAEAPVVPPL